MSLIVAITEKLKNGVLYMILTFSFQNINLYGHNSETVSGTQIRTRSVLGWMQIMLVVGQVSANLFRTER